LFIPSFCKMKLRFCFLCMLTVVLGDHAWIACGQETRRNASYNLPSAALYRGGLVSPPLPKPEFVLTDTSGARFDFWKETRGSVTLLFFGYTSCPDQCPTHMANLAAALKRLPTGIADHVKLVFITTDPARDSPVKLRRWLDNFDKRFVGLTGSDAALEAVQKSAGVPLAYKTEPTKRISPIAHANFVVAYTKDNLAHVIYPGGVTTEDWIHDLPLLTQQNQSQR